jgi:hypothetical protein
VAPFGNALVCHPEDVAGAVGRVSASGAGIVGGAMLVTTHRLGVVSGRWIRTALATGHCGHTKRWYVVLHGRVQQPVGDIASE